MDIKKMKCPCCGNYTIYEIFDICDVCLWQYDEVYHDKPEKSGGANKICLNEARKNYKEFGVSKRKYIGSTMYRLPLSEELPENNE